MLCTPTTPQWPPGDPPSTEGKPPICWPQRAVGRSWGAKPLVVNQQSTRDPKIRSTMQPLMFLPPPLPCPSLSVSGTSAHCATSVVCVLPCVPPWAAAADPRLMPPRGTRGWYTFHQGAHQGHSNGLEPGTSRGTACRARACEGPPGRRRGLAGGTGWSGWAD